MKEKIKKIADYYKLQHQLNKLNEELIELLQANQDYSLKLALNDDDINMDHLVEEMADVSIMIEQLIYLLEAEELFEAIKELKVNRQIGRIAEENQ